MKRISSCNHPHRLTHRWSLFAPMLLTTLALAVGCHPSRAERLATEKAEKLQLIRDYNYRTPQGTKQECLGRLVFDVAGDIDWAVPTPGVVNVTSGDDYYGFPEGFAAGPDELWIGTLGVKIYDNATRVSLDEYDRSFTNPGNDETAVEAIRRAHRRSIDRIYQSKRPKKENIIHRLQTELESRKRRVKGLAENRNNEDPVLVKEALENTKQDVREYEAAIVRVQNASYDLDLGSDTLAYRDDPEIYAVTLRNGRAYEFTSKRGEKFSDEASHLTWFRKMFASFQPRELYDIPKTPGVCIPYGFLPDDGSTPYTTAMTWRYRDRPGVTYNLNTGTARDDDMSRNPGAIEALSRGAIGALGGVLTEGRVIKSIGLGAKIGPLEASQGGSVLNTADPGQPVVPNYSVYTGFDGVEGSDVLPYIIVDLLGFTKEQVEKLPDNPPPFEESEQRLDAFLKSLRLRPTDPVMPELKESAR